MSMYLCICVYIVQKWASTPISWPCHGPEVAFHRCHADGTAKLAYYTPIPRLQFLTGNVPVPCVHLLGPKSEQLLTKGAQLWGIFRHIKYTWQDARIVHTYESFCCSRIIYK